MKQSSFWLVLTPTLALVLGSVLSDAFAKNKNHPQGRTWKTVDELSPEELRAVDLATDTTRHSQFPYLPAEPYPFTAPYTAEEMGYRAMEFTQRPRWSCVFVNIWGSISAQGVLLNPGKSIAFVSYSEPAGVGAELIRIPGEEFYRYLTQNVFPPDREGSQWLAIRYRTDHVFVKKEESFMYSLSTRRVRHQVPSRRQDKFPNQAQTLDDATGRDAWEFSWRLIGTDILYQTMRFPVTRPTITLGNGQDGRLHTVRTADLKLMGDTYPYYTADGGVECYVVEARARKDWLPDYYAPRLLYWLDKHSFYPLRVEQYGQDGKLALIEVRLTEMFNPTLGERGYGPLFLLYWDISSDIMSYMVRDNHRLKEWSPEEHELFFSPDFMRRQWFLDRAIKSQAEVFHPDLFFLRPALEADKFPDLRPMQLPVEVAARVQAQEMAGQLVFEVDEVPTDMTAQAPQSQEPVVWQTEGRSEMDGTGAQMYTLRSGQSTPTPLH